MNKNKILVVGGAGYIGAHMVKLLNKRGHDVIVLDNLSTGHSDSVRTDQLVVGDLADERLLNQLFTDHDFEIVMHFAASSLVGESMQNPGKYYRNNVCNTLNLLDAMVKGNVRHIVFSSTAAIYGEPEYVPIDELHPKKPINPYGSSKLMIENILQSYGVSHGVNSVSLRYFNACGSDPDGDLGEEHDPETHLIPLILKSALKDKGSIRVYGTDYDTRDGTCIRDFIDVQDLCLAHLSAMNNLISNQFKGASSFNLGTGKGYSVQEVIDIAREIVRKDGNDISIDRTGRRKGDPAILVANGSSAEKELKYCENYVSIEESISNAWKWYRKGEKYE